MTARIHDLEPLVTAAAAGDRDAFGHIVTRRIDDSALG